MIEYETSPIGNEGHYAVRRFGDGTVTFLAGITTPDRIGRYSFGLATATCVALRGAKPGEMDDYVWLPWPTHDLGSMRPMSMFPPARRSAYDTSGRA